MTVETNVIEDEEVAEGGRVHAGELLQNIEEDILNIIRKGAGAGENIGLRPLREIFQNSDDEQSDRLYIGVLRDALYAINDGNTLTGEFKGQELVGGTCRMIMGLSMASKKRDASKSGNFGTGLRSAHAMSHFIEVHGRVARLDDGISLEYAGRSNAYTHSLEEDIERIKFGVRNDSFRPVCRVPRAPAKERRGVMIRLPWREGIPEGSVDPEEWEEFCWDATRISGMADDFAVAAPRILAGCSWLREVVLDIDIDGREQRIAWVRDYNIEEYLEDAGARQVKLTEYRGNKTNLTDAMSFDIHSLEEVDSSDFILISCSNETLSQIAGKAYHKPACMMLIPLEPDRNMPAYTPIALTGDCGNRFGPIAFLPPDESRACIKIDGVMAPKQNWAAQCMATISQNLLPQVLELLISRFKDDPNNIISLLPTGRPDRWYTSGIGMSLPASPLPDWEDRLHASWELMEEAWDGYTATVAESSLFPSDEGELVSAQEVVNISMGDENASKIIQNVLESLGFNVLNGDQRRILDGLNSDDWGENHPLKKMRILQDPRHLTSFLNEKAGGLNVDTIGIELVQNLVTITLLDPPTEWEGSADLERVPVIPDIDGILRPLKETDEQGNIADQFYEASDELPDILPNHRRVHLDFIPHCAALDFGQPPTEKLAQLVHEASVANPDIYEDLHSHPDIHRQVSEALVRICSSEVSLSTVQDFCFIPCLKGGKVQTRRVNHVGDLVWMVSPELSTGRSPWRNFCHRDFIFGDLPDDRNGFDLHESIFERLTWLELSSDHREHVDNICEELKIHQATAASYALNLIRSLIFGQYDNLGSANPESLFVIKKDEKGGIIYRSIDKWMGKKLSEKERDEALESVLSLLEDYEHLSTGWGADATSHIHNLHLLKGEDGEWHRVGDLCYEFTSDLRELFDKVPIFQSHREMLHEDLLTLPVGKARGAGLGITRRITEDVIVKKLETLNGQDSGIRNQILTMMLNSADAWEELEKLQTSPWVPRDGELARPSECLLPSLEMIALFGDDHPWFIDCSFDRESSTVLERAEELNLMHSVEDPQTLLNALLGPDEIWDGLQTSEVLELLRTMHNEDTSAIAGYPRRLRLPILGGGWSDESWLVDSEEVEPLSTLFPGQNVTSRDQLGSAPIERMAKVWILPRVIGPTVGELMGRLSDESRSDPGDPGILNSLWNLLAGRIDDEAPDEDEDTGETAVGWPNRDAAMRLKIPLESGIEEVASVIMVGPQFSELAEPGTLEHHVVLDSNHQWANLLRDRMHKREIDTVTSDEFRQSIANISVDDARDIEAWLLQIAVSPPDLVRGELVDMPIWPYESRNDPALVSSLTLTPSDRHALIPMERDEGSEVARMIAEGLPLFIIPREGHLSALLYNILEEGDELTPDTRLPFINRHLEYQTPEGDEDEGTLWDSLVRPMNNIIKALVILGVGMRKCDDVDVRKTDRIVGRDGYARVGPGARPVLYRKNMKHENVTSYLIEEGRILRIRVSIARYNKRSDDELRISLQAGDALGIDIDRRTVLQQLIDTEESGWGLINPDLEELSQGRSHPRPLIEEGIYSEMRAEFQRRYGGCQICGRMTPENRLGDFQEGVVGLFNVGYYSDSGIPYGIGNALYLCPVHKALHNRNLLQFTEIDGAIEATRRNPDQLDEIVQRMLGDDGQMTLEAVTYERPENAGDPRDITHEVDFHTEHAAGLRDAVSQHLRNRFGN